MTSVTCMEMRFQDEGPSYAAWHQFCGDMAVLTTTCSQQIILQKEINHRTPITFDGLCPHLSPFSFQIVKDTDTLILCKDRQKDTAVC